MADGAEGLRTEPDGQAAAFWRMRPAHPDAGQPFYPVPQSRKGYSVPPKGLRFVIGTQEPMLSARFGAGLAAANGDGPHGGGALVVVGARESRVHGEGGRKLIGIRMTEKISVDSDNQADRAWLLGVQRKLYRWSKETPEGAYGDVWNWVTDPRNLRCAWQTVAQNKGRRTPGVDGLTVASIAAGDGGVPLFLDGLREALRTGSYRPSPARRKWIPKPGKPGKFRPLGIPTVADRVVQGAVKNILEPIFEARFWQVSYGFRPGRGCHGALEHIRLVTRPRRSRTGGQMRDPPYQWVIEGDIEGCFDNIGHHHLMDRVRKSCADRKVNRLIVRFLKAGVLEDFRYNPTTTGTPQGGVLSPLLANIALSAIEERYWRWVRHPHDPKRRTDGARMATTRRYRDREAGRPVFYPVRYMQTTS